MSNNEFLGSLKSILNYNFWEQIGINIWDEFKDKFFYIVGIILLILVPFIILAPGYGSIPILSDIFAIGRDAGLFPNSNIRILRILSIAAILAIFTASWDLLSGYTGQFSFGHAIFWGFSAYLAFWFASGIQTGELVIENFFGPGENFVFQLDFLTSILGPVFQLDPGMAIVAGALGSAILATAIGLITLRIKGPYFALVTLILPFIFVELIKIFRNITQGNFGIPNIPSVLEVAEDREIAIIDFYTFALLIFFVCVGIMILIAYSRIGLAFQSVREDQDAAESLGINLTFYKVLAFAISAFFAGIAGGLFAQLDHFVGPSFFEATNSFTVIIFAVVGGIGSITGGVIGAFMLTILVEFILIDVFPRSTNPGVDVLAFGLVLIIALRYIPLGLSRAKKDEKRGLIVGVMFALTWIIGGSFLNNIDLFWNQNTIGQLTFVLLFLFSLPAIPIFIISEIIGLFIFENVIGLNLVGSALIKSKFLIYIIVGIPYAYYLPKLFKKIRLKYWGIWPSVGQYEPE
jgi:branched-chain amino acid transport system permease protein